MGNVKRLKCVRKWIAAKWRTYGQSKWFFTCFTDVWEWKSIVSLHAPRPGFWLSCEISWFLSISNKNITCSPLAADLQILA